MENQPTQFAFWLDATMKQRGLSQADLARAVGVADAQVSRWRRGQVVPTVRYLQQIADVMGVQRVTLDRLAGYPVAEQLSETDASGAVAEAEIAAYQARFAEILRSKIPPAMWQSYVAACESLADGLSATLRNLTAHAGDQESNNTDRGMGFRR